MTGHPVKYFEHYADGGRCLAVHRLDELVMVSFSSGPGDESPLVMFFGPTAGHGLADAVDSAAQDGRAVFEANRPAPRRGPGPDVQPSGDLPAWGPAFTYGGLPVVDCPAGDRTVACGQSARVETATGRIWHDDCAEANGAVTYTVDEIAAAIVAIDDSLTSASEPPVTLRGSGAAGGSDGAAGADRASAVPCRPAAPSTSRRS